MRVRDRQKVKKKYPNGGTGGWNLKKPINKIDALREEILDLQQQNLDLATDIANVTNELTAALSDASNIG